MTMEKYIELLCELRDKYGLFTPTEAAFYTGVSASTVYYFEHGKSKNSKLLLYYVRRIYKDLKYNGAKIAKAYGISFAEAKKDANKVLEGLMEVL